MTDASKFIRDKARVMKDLVSLQSGKVVTKTGCKIYMPYRYLEHSLAYIGNTIQLIGLFPIVVQDTYYSLVCVNTMMSIQPVVSNRVKIDGEDYFEFIFTPGSTVFPSNQVAKIDTIPYLLFDEFLSKAKIPWFVSYENIGQLFSSARKFAGSNVVSNSSVVEMLYAHLARDPDDKTKFFRHTLKTQDDLVTKRPVYVPLTSRTYSATNTLNRMTGSRMDEGIRASLIYPSDKVEKTDDILTQ